MTEVGGRTSDLGPQLRGLRLGSELRGLTSVFSLPQLFVQIGERVFEQLTVPGILAYLQLLKHSLARQSKALFLAPAGRFVSAHRRTQFGGFVVRFRLLRFHRFAFPASGHGLIIVRTDYPYLQFRN
jgi:hypothetical protein